MADSITATVVIASFSNPSLLGACLDSLKDGAPGAEIIVSSCLPESSLAQLMARHDARFLFHDDDSGTASAAVRETRVFRLRSTGVLAARGEIIALLEDHCTVSAGWLEGLLERMDGNRDIVGGGIDCAADCGPYSLALYYAEYAQLMPPCPDRPSYLSAANCAYRRSALMEILPLWKQGFYDNEVLDGLLQNGGRMKISHVSTVCSTLPFRFDQALIHLYTGGRRYGSYRYIGSRRWRRILRMPLLLLLPAVLLARIIGILQSRNPRRLPNLLLAMPALLMLLCAWTAGEFAGTACPAAEAP